MNPTVISQWGYAMDMNCSECGADLKVDPEWAGRKAYCNACNAQFIIPSAPPEASDKSPTAARKAKEPVAKTTKAELEQLIRVASDGDSAAARKLIGPFVSPEEKLLMHGVSAKFGFFPTYDFYFLTDRRVGDLEITPLTGSLNVEVAYIQKLDAFVLSQPAFPIMLRLFLASFYVVLPVFSFILAQSVLADGLGLWTPLSFVVALAVGVGMIAVTKMFVSPAIRRAFLRLKKSGLWLKLQGNPVGVLIFADRDKFELLTTLTRAMTDVKRQLDKIAS